MNQTWTKPIEFHSQNYTVVLRSYSVVLQNVSIILFLLLFCFGGLLDIFVIYVMVRSGQLRKNISSFLIFHLSFTHLLFHIFFAMTVPGGPLKGRSVFMCKMSAFIEHACPATIFSTLVAIAWERQKNILQPFKSLAVISFKSYLLVVTIIWGYSITSSVSFVYSVGVQSVNVCRNSTQEGCEEYTLCHVPSDWETQTSETIYFFMAFFVPLSYMSVVYIRIAVSLWKRSKNGMIHSAVAKHKTKSIRLLLAAVLGFVVCWGPSILFNLLDKYVAWQSFEREYILQFWSTFIAPASSSCINTAVYAYFSPEFRKNCMRFGCCCCSLGRPFIQRCCRRCNVVRRASPGEAHAMRTRQNPAS